MNLYEQADALDKAMADIDQWIAEHQEEIEAAGGELPKEITAEYDKLMADQKDSVAWHAKKIQQYDAEIHMIDTEQQRLKARREQIARKQAWRERMLFEYMKREGLDLVRHPLVTVSIKKNPPKVVAPMWTQLELGQLWASPKYDWCVIRKEPEFSLDRNKIKEYLRSGEGNREGIEIPEGVKIVQDETLRIK